MALHAEVRAYEAIDRDDVRRIAYDTGLMGQSIAGQWQDLESWANITTGYYTDQESNNALVAVIGEKVVGYLLGCQDSSKVPDPGIVGLKQVLKRGLFIREGTAGMVWKTLGDGIKDTATGSVKQSDLHFSDPRWPAHFHINLEPEARRLGLGSEMLNQWLDKLRMLGVAGCHLNTLTSGGKSPAMLFFEKHGFYAHGKQNLLPGMRSEAGGRVYAQVMVRDI